MLLTLYRRFKGTEYTIGSLFIDGQYFCDTLEDVDRGLTSEMTAKQISRKKVYGKTAIPTGKYEVTIDQVSQKYASRAAYKAIKGKLPRLLNVTGYTGILIHAGNSADDTAGCVLVGQNLAKGKVLNSTVTFYKLYPHLQRAKGRGEKIYIEII